MAALAMSDRGTPSARYIVVKRMSIEPDIEGSRTPSRRCRGRSSLKSKSSCTSSGASLALNGRWHGLQPQARPIEGRKCHCNR